MVRVLAIGDAMESYEDYRCLAPTIPPTINGEPLARSVPGCLDRPDLYKYPAFEKVLGEYYVDVPNPRRTGFRLRLTEPSDDIWIHTKIHFTTGDYSPNIGDVGVFDILQFVDGFDQPLVRIEQAVDENDTVLRTTLIVGSLSEDLVIPFNIVTDIDMHFAHNNFELYLDGVYVPLSNQNLYQVTAPFTSVIFGDPTRIMYNTTRYKFFVVGRDPMLGYEVETVYPTRGSDFLDDWAPPSEAAEFTDRKAAANLIPYSSYIGRFNKAAQTFSFGPINERMPIAATQLNGVFYGATEGVSTYFIESTFDNIVDLSTANPAGTAPTHVKQITTEPLHIDNEQTQFGFLMEKVE